MCKWRIARANSRYNRCLHTWSTKKFHLGYQINRAGNTLLTDSHNVIYPDRLMTLFKTERTENHGPAAHPCISHIREYPPEHKYPTTSLFHFRQEPIEGNLRG